MIRSLLLTAVMACCLAHAEAPPQLSPQVWELASRTYQQLATQHKVHTPRLTVIDYSLPSTQKRLWVVDMNTGQTLFHEYVAHGRNTGDNRAQRFGNEPGSLQSSLGVFLTGETYSGQHGRSLKLDGLEQGFNHLARSRAVVIHPADYATPQFAKKHGRLGRSHGCPAVSPQVADALIDAIADRSVLFIYGLDPNWLTRYRFLKSATTR